METLLILSIAIIAGLFLSRLAKKLQLPAVTAYLVAGILIGPYCLGRLGINGLGFTNMEQVSNFSLISDMALGFIAFQIGNEFRLPQLKKIGKQATIIGIFQAVVATLAVDAALIGLHFIIPEKFPISAALVLGAVASATAPAATLMVVRQYKAKGPLTDILLPVVAIDDAVGLVLFAISFGVAKALKSGYVNVVSLIVEPLLEIILSLILGAVMGYIFTFAEKGALPRIPSKDSFSSRRIVGAPQWKRRQLLAFHIKPTMQPSMNITYITVRLLPAFGAEFGNVVSVDHEGFDGIARFNFFACCPLVVQFSNGLADGHGRLSAGTGYLAFCDEGLDVGGAVYAVDQSLGACCFSCCIGAQSRRIVAAEDANCIGVSGQSVGAVLVAQFLVAHGVELCNYVEALAFDSGQEAISTVYNRLHGGAVQNDDVAAFGALFEQVEAANIAGVVVIGASIGYEILVSHGNFGIEAEDRDASCLQSVQSGDDAFAVNGVYEHCNNALSDDVFNQSQLLFVGVLGIQGDQLVAVCFNDFADGAFQSYKEGVGAVHAGVTDLVTFCKSYACQYEQGNQNERDNFLHGLVLLVFCYFRGFSLQ